MRNIFLFLLVFTAISVVFGAEKAVEAAEVKKTEKAAEMGKAIKNIIVPGVFWGLPLVSQPEVSADELLKTFSTELQGHRIWVFVAEKSFFDTVEIGLQELYVGFFNDFFRRAPLDWGHQDISVSGEELRNPRTLNIGKDLDLAFNFFPVVKGAEKQFVFFACLVSRNKPVYFISRFSIKANREAFVTAFSSFLSTND